jgi:hypothetical protein
MISAQQISDIANRVGLAFRLTDLLASPGFFSLKLKASM